MNTIKEVIVVEGRDDTAAVKRALDCETIETHGFGISASSWRLIAKAYSEKGIIIFTDPDHAGEEIRRKLTERFPEAKQAYLPRREATKAGDIGIENAEPEAIMEALTKAHCTLAEKRTEFTMEDMTRYGLTGVPEAGARREALGKYLGIGYGNTGSFLKKLNKYNISREDFLKYEAILTRGDTGHQG